MMTARDRAAMLLTLVHDRLDDRGDQVRLSDNIEIVDALVDAVLEALHESASGSAEPVLECGGARGVRRDRES